MLACVYTSHPFSENHSFPLLHTASHCNILQHTATHCNTLQHAATCCNMLQHAATCCNMLQHAATRSFSNLNLFLHDMTHSCVRHDLRMRRTLLIHVCNINSLNHTLMPSSTKSFSSVDVCKNMYNIY